LLLYLAVLGSDGGKKLQYQFCGFGLDPRVITLYFAYYVSYLSCSTFTTNKSALVSVLSHHVLESAIGNSKNVLSLSIVYRKKVIT
jgi:hypothetical protein